MINGEEKLTLNVNDAAKLLGLSRNSIYQAVVKGEIPHIKIGKRILIPVRGLGQLLDEAGK